MRTTSKNFYPIHSLSIFPTHSHTIHSDKRTHTHVFALFCHTPAQSHTHAFILSLSLSQRKPADAHKHNRHSLHVFLSFSLSPHSPTAHSLSLSHATISPFLMFLDLRIEFIGQPLTRDLFQFVQFFLFRSKRRLTKNEARDIFRIKKHDCVDHHRYPPFPGMDVRKEKNGKI